MTLDERIHLLDTIFEDLMYTSSRNDKNEIVACIPDYLKDDFMYCLEILDGKHPLGYTYVEGHGPGTYAHQDQTVRQLLRQLYKPLEQSDLSRANVERNCVETYYYGWFIEPIVNRKLRLGIGRSLFDKDDLSPMLAKKLESSIGRSNHGYFVTEKLDGNRCMALWNGTEWTFTSRNGKPMNVSFDMRGLPTEYLYDGEVLGLDQVNLSLLINNNYGDVTFDGTTAFNKTSGIINSKYKVKNLVYNIFDIVLDIPYHERRRILNGITPLGTNVRVLPVMFHAQTEDELFDYITLSLDRVTSMGGEGLMVNIGDRPYEHKRTNGLLKVKKVNTMDMRVIDYEFGAGKYEGMIGALCAVCSLDDGRVINCRVGTGLSDEQRLKWALNPREIVGKIIEVGYFDISKRDDFYGTTCYSLRFPRLKSVRTDKITTSGW